MGDPAVVARHVSHACVSALGAVWALATTSATRAQLVDLGAHKRVLAILTALLHTHEKNTVRGGPQRDDASPALVVSELEQRLTVYSVGALSMLLCDPRARASLAGSAGAADGASGAVLLQPAAVAGWHVFRRTPDKAGAKQLYHGRLAKSAVGLPDSEAPLPSPPHGVATVTLSASQALSYECLRIVGGSGYLTDDENEHELDEHLPPSFHSSRAAVRSIVQRDADEVAGFSVLGIVACALPTALVPELSVDSRAMAAHAMIMCVVGPRP